MSRIASDFYQRLREWYGEEIANHVMGMTPEERKNFILKMRKEQPWREWPVELKIPHEVDVSRFGTDKSEPSSEMNALFEERTLQHIDRVRNNMKTLSDSMTEINPEEALKRGEQHDQSKYEDGNRVPYTWNTLWHRNNHDDSIYPPGMKEEVEKATKKHIQNEPHHPDSWENVQEMTPLDIAEMVSDWFAMSQELNDDIYEFEKKKVPKYSFSPEQTELIRKMTDALMSREKQMFEGKRQGKRIFQSLNRDAKIVHEKGKWWVKSEKGKNMGKYDTKEEAVSRLRQVEYFKHHGKRIFEK
jgi:hypothetical protein